MTTYKLASGDPVCGEFSYVNDLDYFEDDDEPTDVVKEVWVRKEVETITVRPSGWEQCPLCGEWSGWVNDCIDEHLAVLEEVLEQGWCSWRR